MVPLYGKTFELPFGVTDVQVTVTPHSISEQQISKEITPTPQKVTMPYGGEMMVSGSEKNLEIYASNQPYPSEWFSYNVGCGLNKDGEHVTYLDALPLNVESSVNHVRRHRTTCEILLPEPKRE